MSILFIVNTSASRTDEKTISTVAHVLGAMGRVSAVDVGGDQTSNAKLERIARRADLVVVAGGDGTLNHVANALRPILPDVVLGIVPLGTGNDLAGTLGVATEAIEAAREVVAGTSRLIDVGRVQAEGVDRLFLNACIGGFPVEVDRAIGDDMKKRLGRLAFWVGGAKAATDLSPFDAVINGTVLRDCLAVGVGNGKTCGGGFRVWPNALPDDGLLDACALPLRTLPGGAELLVKVKEGRHEEIEDVMTRTGRRLEIDSDPKIEINVDGELLGVRTPATFTLAGKIRIRC